jgi:nucleoid-associated protein YgaU
MTKEMRLVPTLIALSGLAVVGAAALYFGLAEQKPSATSDVASLPVGGAVPIGAPASVAPAPAVGHALAPLPPADASAAKGAEAAKPQAGRDAKPAGKAEDKPAGKAEDKPAGKAEAKLEQKAAAKPAEEAALPAFDVVRVEPTGEAVIAGRAAPGATVELLRDGVQYDRVVADTSGLFAMTPKPLPPGNHDLTLRFTAPNGQQALSRQSVTVVVAANRKDAPVVALAAPGLPTVVLSNPSPPQQALAGVPGGKPAAGAGPGAAAGQPATAPARPSVLVETVETEDGGKLFVTGRAAAGATLRLYLNDAYLASGTSAPEGRLSFTIGSGVAPGDYRIRLDDVDPVTGQVKSRAEVPFNVPRPVVAAVPLGTSATSSTLGGGASGVNTPVASVAPLRVPASDRVASGSAMVIVPDIKTALVTRGDSLWRISKRIYGQGMRYTVIYQANQEQIRNPRLIYPGQTFVVPGERL